MIICIWKVSCLIYLFYFYFFKDFIYSFDREGTQARGVGEGEGEAGFPQSREPDAGLDPRTLGS